MSCKNREVMAISTGSTAHQAGPERARFRLKFIALPLSMLGASIVLSAVFYSLLPDPAAYRFQADAADQFVSRNALLAWLILPHLVFTGMSYVLVQTVLLSARSMPAESPFVMRILPAT